MAYDGPVLEILFGALTSPDDDAELVRRVANGEAAALRTLYERLSPQILAVTLRVLRDQREAEEAVQDAFVEAWKRAGDFDRSRGSVVGWLVSIARSRAIDRLRSRSAVERLAVRAAAEPGETFAPPIELAERREERTRIQAALSQLTPAQREAIELAYFEGLTQREIALRAGEPLGTIKSRVRTALQKLLSLLGEGGAP